MMYHANDGLFFKRGAEESAPDDVTIIKTTDGLAPADDDSNVLFRQTMKPGVWGSVVCSVSQGGEDFTRWSSVMAFHGLQEISPEDVQRLMKDPVTP